MACDPDTEDCRAAGVDEPEANPFALPYLERLGILRESTVDQEPLVGRPNVTHHPASSPYSAPHSSVRRKLRLSREVIIDDHDVFAVVLDVRVTFFDDQWAEQSTVELEPDVTVVKIRSGGFGTVRVRERIAGIDRVLRYARHSIHRIWDGNSVPVNRRLRLEFVGQFDAEYVSFLNA